MSAHTPGPWRYRVGDQWSHSIVTDHGLLPDESPSSWAVASINVQRDEYKANARLMAAAPELHEALALIASTDATDAALDPQRAIRVAKEAIRKITGEKP